MDDKGTALPTREHIKGEPELPEALAKRLVFSLMKGAARLGARFGLDMQRFMEVAQAAYFEEHRRRCPGHLAEVAANLRLSLRHVGTINRRFKRAFFRPEQESEPLRRVTAALAAGPLSWPALKRASRGIRPGDLRRAVARLEANGWVEREGDQLRLAQSLRVHLDDTLLRRVDGLNHQLEIISDAVWARFVAADEEAVARSWAFVARPADLAHFAAQTVRTLRHGAVDLEEEALGSAAARRYGVTVAFTPLDDRPGHGLASATMAPHRGSADAEHTKPEVDRHEDQSESSK